MYLLQLLDHKFNFMLSNKLYLQLTICVTDNNVQDTMLQDDTLDILQKIGYSGVPQHETTLTCKKVVQ